MSDVRLVPLPVAAREETVACHECDLVQRLRYPPRSRVVRCARCGGVLLRHDPDGVSRTLALALASMIMFMVANAFPVVAIDMQGNTAASSLTGAVVHLWRDRMYAVAVLVALTTVVAPAGMLGMLVYVLGAVRLGLRPPAAPLVLRALHLSRPWGMIEVFLLGVLVSVVKLTHYASVMPGLSMWALLLLIPLMAAMSASFHPDVVWRRLGGCREGPADGTAARTGELPCVRAVVAPAAHRSVRSLPALRCRTACTQAEQPDAHLGLSAGRLDSLHSGQCTADHDYRLHCRRAGGHHPQRRGLSVGQRLVAAGVAGV